MGVLELNKYCILTFSATEGYIDENGDPQEGSIDPCCCYKCDIVPAGSDNSITFDDGEVDHYSYTIYLPKDCREFKRGEKIFLKRFDVKEEFIVKGFHRYQLQAKLWV